MGYLPGVQVGILTHAPSDLGSLASNGGPTQTILPEAGNPAIGLIPVNTTVTVDKTSVTLCPTTDQRGFTTTPGQPCDAGSVQFLSQTISFAAPSSATVGSSITLSATGGASGQPVLFSVAPTSGVGVCSTSGSNGQTLSFTGVGTCIIDANQAGTTTTYLPASTVSQTITVSVPPAIRLSKPARLQAVTIKTGPPVAPSDQSPLVPIGLGLTATGLLGVLGFGLKRRKTA